MYRRQDGVLQIFLVHPGGPFWAKKDAGAWSIPKGEFAPDEDPLAAAQREFSEETGFQADGRFIPLAPLKQPSGKTIHAWAVEGDADAARIRSNNFSMEWPPGSGKQQEFPEVDRAAWFTIEAAEEMVASGQKGFIDELQRVVGESPPEAA